MAVHPDYGMLAFGPGSWVPASLLSRLSSKFIQSDDLLRSLMLSFFYKRVVVRRTVVSPVCSIIISVVTIYLKVLITCTVMSEEAG